MILLKILEHDLHFSRKGRISETAIPLMIEVPVPKTEVLQPFIISGASGKFLVSRTITNETRVKVGVFQYDPDRIDEIIGSIFESVLKLSREEKWKNLFKGRDDSAEQAFLYVKSQSGSGAQPHACLIPKSMTPSEVTKFFGKKNLDDNSIKYRKICRVIPAPIPYPVFCSRPDMTGMITQFVGGRFGIILHNVRMGFGLCPDVIPRSLH